MLASLSEPTRILSFHTVLCKGDVVQNLLCFKPMVFVCFSYLLFPVNVGDNLQKFWSFKNLILEVLEVTNKVIYREGWSAQNTVFAIHYLDGLF